VTEVEFAAYSHGTEKLTALRPLIEKAWQQTLGDADQAQAIASILNISIDRLGAESPINAKAAASGITGFEGALLLFAADWLADLGKDLAKDAIEEAAKKIWQEYIKPKLPHGAIGDEKTKPHSHD
jgi:hypothetical protein